MDVRADGQLERLSVTTRHSHERCSPRCQYDGCFVVSAAPIVDWEFDVGVQGRSLSTGKLVVRAERQLLSDLTGSRCALTAFAAGSISGRQRARHPVFFEMAQSGAEMGVGVGRHLIIRPRGYVQLFSYVSAGAGTHHAAWAQAEVGLQAVYQRRHTIRVSYMWTDALGHGRIYRGVGTLHTHIDGYSANYTYRWLGGIEARLTYLFRHPHHGLIRTSTAAMASLSIPMAL